MPGWGWRHRLACVSHSAYAAGDDVLDFKDSCYECLSCPTIGAPIHEPRTDATSQAGWNIGTHDEYSVPA